MRGRPPSYGAGRQLAEEGGGQNHMAVSKNLGPNRGSPYKKGHNIFGFIFGSPHMGRYACTPPHKHRQASAKFGRGYSPCTCLGFYVLKAEPRFIQRPPSRIP